jgi:outer membrane protein assembly factor BamB
MVMEGDGTRLLEYRKGVVLSKPGRDTLLTKHRLLDAAFSPSEVVIAEFGGALRCFDTDGVELWALGRSDTGHFTNVYYSNTMDLFYAIFFEFQGPSSGSSTLYAIDQYTGDLVKISETGSWAYDLSDPTRCLITAHGDAIDLASGLRSAALAVPQTDYPDPQSG